MFLLLSFKRALLRFLLWLMLMLALMVPLTWVGMKYPHHLQNISHVIIQHNIYFIFFRWALIMALFIIWPRLIKLVGSRRNWSTEKSIFWLNQRLRIVIWLALFELIICENIFVLLLRSL